MLEKHKRTQNRRRRSGGSERDVGEDRRKGKEMTPQEAYEKRYANIDGGQHTWDAAPPHVKEMWLAAWTIAWAMAESGERLSFIHI